MRRTLAFAAFPLVISLFPAFAQDAGGVGELKTFSDWVVGCDNHLACTAIGMVADMEFDFAYVRIERGPTATAPLGVRIVAVTDDAGDGARTLSLALDAGEPLSAPSVATSSGNFATADLDAANGAAFVQALLPRNALAVAIEGGEPATVSLAGMSAALRWLDERQGRVGASDAIVAVGDRAPAAPTIPDGVELAASVALKSLDPLPDLPDAVTAPNPDCNEFAEPVAYALADDPTERPVIAGRCQFSGAYNFGYGYVLLGEGAPTPLVFALPGRAPAEGEDASILVNADISANGSRIVSFNKGRGIGDCGATSEWAFDGTAVRLSLYAEMTECRGVSPDDWPVLYRASAN